jgi:hypothetical protein
MGKVSGQGKLDLFPALLILARPLKIEQTLIIKH